MVHTIHDTRTADVIEDEAPENGDAITVRIEAFDSFEVDVTDGVVIVTSDGCSFVGQVADVDNDDVLIELA